MDAICHSSTCSMSNQDYPQAACSGYFKSRGHPTRPNLLLVCRATSSTCLERVKATPVVYQSWLRVLSMTTKPTSASTQILPPGLWNPPSPSPVGIQLAKTCWLAGSLSAGQHLSKRCPGPSQSHGHPTFFQNPSASAHRPNHVRLFSGTKIVKATAPGLLRHT
jgi:hypothetical protein